MAEPLISAGDKPTVPVRRLCQLKLRTSRRRTCQSSVRCVLAGPGYDGDAKIANVSAGGLGLLVRCPLDQDTPIILKLKARHDEHFQEFRATVIHVTPQSEGEWLVGCKLACRLTPRQLRVFYATHAEAAFAAVAVP